MTVLNKARPVTSDNPLQTSRFPQYFGVGLVTLILIGLGNLFFNRTAFWCYPPNPQTEAIVYG